MSFFSPVFAADINLVPQGSDFARLTELDIGGVISGMISLVMLVAALIFFFYLVWGGIKWIMSQGDEAKVKEARDQVTQALVGLAVVFVAFAIVKMINVIFGINILELNIPKFF